MLIEQDSEDMEMEPVDILKECDNRLRDSEDKSQNVEDYERILELSNINKSTRELGEQLIPHYLKFFKDLSIKAFEGLVNILTSEESLNPPSVSVEALISLLETVVPFFEIETSAPSRKFFDFLNTHFDKLPQDSKIRLVKSLTKISLHTRDTKDMLQSIFSFLTICMKAADLVQEMDLTIVESLLYVFHHLADKNPDLGKILCSPDALSLFTTFAEITKTRMARLTQLMTDLDNLIWQLQSEEDSLIKMIDKTYERDDTKTQLRACNNIISMLQDVQNVPLSFIGESIINLSWKELRKPSPLRCQRIPMDYKPPTMTHFEEKLKLDPRFREKLD